METKQLKVNGQMINIRVKNAGNDKCIVFVHGNSASSRAWSAQFEDQLFSAFHLIAPDLPGHGASQPAIDPGYLYSPVHTAELLADTIHRVVNGRQFVVVGHSYGSNVVSEAMRYSLKPAGVVLTGACVLGEAFGMDKVFQPSEQPSIFFYNEENASAVEEFLKVHVHDDKLVKLLAEDYKNTDKAFKPALMEAAQNAEVTDEIESLQKLSIPVCVVNGKRDKVVNTEYMKHTGIQLWRNEIFILEHANHYPHLEEPETFNRILYDYAAERLQ